MAFIFQVLRFSVLLWTFASSLSFGNACVRSMGHNPAFRYSQQFLENGPQNISISSTRIEAVAREMALLKIPISKPSWNFAPYPTDDEASFTQMFRFFLIVNSINFRYFDQKSGQTYSDGESIGAGLLVKKLWNEREKVLKADFLSKLTASQLAEITDAAVPLPAIAARVKNLKAVGKFLSIHPGLSTESGIVEFLEGFSSGLALSVYIGNQISAYNDPFLKRAQLFVGMLIGRYGTSGALPEALRDTSGMTVYADYILPMILRRMGILEYNEYLLTKIGSQKNIPSGSVEEEEIRAMTIVASQMLLNALRAHEPYAQIDALDLDAILWLQSREVPVPDFLILPDHLYINGSGLSHHRTISSHY